MSKLANISKHRKSSETWIIWSAILAMILVIIVVISVMVVKRSITIGVLSAESNFSDSYDKAKNDAYGVFRDTAYLVSEKANHVSNDITIKIGAVKEKSDLEVLKVSDIVYIVTEGKDTKSGTTSWLKVDGTGVFTVNLAAAEYLVDNVRHYVLVRIPMPILDSKNITIESFESLYYNENKWNSKNSIRSGELLAGAQLNEAQMQIQEDFNANENYTKFAQSSAASMISALIQGLNSDIADLSVEVEFY